MIFLAIAALLNFSGGCDNVLFVERPQVDPKGERSE